MGRIKVSDKLHQGRNEPRRSIGYKNKERTD
jgi:hypothetical protein